MRVRLTWTLCKAAFLFAMLFFINEPMVLAQESAALTRELSIKYAAIQAAKVAVEQLSTRQLDRIAEDCTLFILNNASKHKEIGNSKDLVRGYIRERFNKAFDEDLKKIYRSFESQDLKFSEAEYRRDIRESFNKQISGNLSKNISRNFSKVFEKGRSQAVSQQLAQISLQVYPSQKEVEQIDSAGWKTQTIGLFERKLIQRMRRTVEVLFEENEPKVKQAANEIISDIRRQFQEQQNALEEPINETAITENQIINELYLNVQTTIDEMETNAKQNQKIYKIFPTVEKSIVSKAKSTEKDRFKLFIKNFEFTISEETLSAVIQGNLKDHRNYNDSLKLSSKNLFPHEAKEVVDIYSTRIESSSEYQQFRNYLKQLISKNDEIRDALKLAVFDAIKSPLRQVRSDISEKQVEIHFYPIFSGEWAVPENILKKMAYSNFSVHSFEQCIELPLITRNSERYDLSSLLEETENNLLGRVGKLLSEGKRAWNGQLDIVKGKEDEIEKKLSEDVNIKSEEEWISYYTNQVEEEWSKSRFGKIWRAFSVPPPNSATKYSPLFGHVTEEIKKIVHNFFEAAKKKFERQQVEIERQLEIERQKREGERQKGPAVVGGEQSVEKKEPGRGGSQPHPTKGGIPVSWLLWLLLILLIIIVLYLLYRVMKRIIKSIKLPKMGIQRSPKRSWQFGLRSMYFPVKDLDRSVNVFSELVDISPIKRSDAEAVFKRGFHKIVFRKAE